MKICLAAAEVTCFSGSDQLTYTLPHSQTNLDPNPLLPFCYLFFCCGLGRGNCSTVFSVFDSRNSELAFRCSTWKRGTVLFAHINTKSKSHTHTRTHTHVVVAGARWHGYGLVVQLTEAQLPTGLWSPWPCVHTNTHSTATAIWTQTML